MRELRRLFESEVEAALTKGNRLIRSRAKVYKELEEMGLATFTQETVAVDRFGPITASGYELTHGGRLMHCAECLPDLGDGK